MKNSRIATKSLGSYYKNRITIKLLFQSKLFLFTALTIIITIRLVFHQDIAFMLLNAGAYTNLQDRSGDTNLIYACKYIPTLANANDLDERL